MPYYTGSTSTSVASTMTNVPYPSNAYDKADVPSILKDRSLAIYNEIVRQVSAAKTALSTEITTKIEARVARLTRAECGYAIGTVSMIELKAGETKKVTVTMPNNARPSIALATAAHSSTGNTINVALGTWEPGQTSVIPIIVSNKGTATDIVSVYVVGFTPKSH